MDLLKMLSELQQGNEFRGSFIINLVEDGDVQVTMWVENDDTPIVEIIPGAMISMVLAMTGE